MWINSKIIDWFGTNVETVRQMQADLAVVRSERDSLNLQLVTAKTNFEWLRLKVNALEVERAALLEKVYGLKIPIPELAPMHPNVTARDLGTMEDLFNDMGDDEAKRQGLPVYGTN